MRTKRKSLCTAFHLPEDPLPAPCQRHIGASHEHHLIIRFCVKGEVHEHKLLQIHPVRLPPAHLNEFRIRQDRPDRTMKARKIRNQLTIRIHENDQTLRILIQRNGEGNIRILPDPFHIVPMLEIPGIDRFQRSRKRILQNTQRSPQQITHNRIVPATVSIMQKSDHYDRSLPFRLIAAHPQKTASQRSAPDCSEVLSTARSDVPHSRASHHPAS